WQLRRSGTERSAQSECPRFQGNPGWVTGLVGGLCARSGDMDSDLGCYDTAVSSGIIHKRLRDWDSGNHPGYALGCWLRGDKEQVFLFTRDFAVDWTNDLASHCTSWGCCAVFGWGGRLGWLAEVILACGGDISGGSRAAGDAVRVAAA